MSETEHTPEESRNLRARSAAQAAAERLTLQPTGVVKYESRGRVLVVGGEEAQWFAARLTEPLHAEILLTEGEEEAGVPSTSLGGRALSIAGHLGAFRIELGEKGRHNYQAINTDLVVDLGAEPLIASEIPPPGYWRFGREPADLDAAWLAVDGMVGIFEKPRYFDYDPNICAHGRSGQDGCSRCVDACPADAIISIGERVEVNPNLCQGGGICATVCPTGAMRYAYPAAGDTAERVRVMLKTYLEAGGSDPVVMFAAESDAADLPPTPPNVLLTVVEELASVGHELWLAAIAWGARCVLLADGGSVPGEGPRCARPTDRLLRGTAAWPGLRPLCTAQHRYAERTGGVSTGPWSARSRPLRRHQRQAPAGRTGAGSSVGGIVEPTGGLCDVCRRALRAHPGRYGKVHAVHGLYFGMPGACAQRR